MIRHWNPEADGEFSEAALRRKLESQGYVVTRYIFPPGTVFEEHTHPVDKIDAVVSGRFRLVVAGHFAVLGPGDWIAVRRGVYHSAAVIGSEQVVSLDGVLVRPSATRDGGSRPNL